MKVVFLSPTYPIEMLEFTRGLSEVGAQVYGVSDAAYSSLPASVKKHLTGYLQVPRLLDEDDVMNRVSHWLKGTTVDRVVANWEPLVLLAARLRERWSLPGMAFDVVLGFRDKQLMKERVQAAGLRVPRSHRVKSAREAYVGAEAVGYPLVIKPIAGAGSADTYVVASELELTRVLGLIHSVPEAVIEEFIEGVEYTYDAVSVQGMPRIESVMQYFPKPLEARTHEWISPGQVTIRDLSQSHLQPGIELGRNVLKALGMGEGYSHMEWFLTPNGEAVFSEVGCRSGGGFIVDQINYCADIDSFREWARAVCWHDVEVSSVRKYNVAGVFKRAAGRGRITRIDGLLPFMKEFGPYVVQERLSRPGTIRRNWKQTLISDGWIMMRHPDWDTALHMMREAARRISLTAE